MSDPTTSLAASGALSRAASYELLSTRRLGEELRSGNLDALGPLLDVYGARIRRLLSIRLGVRLRELLSVETLLAGVRELARARLAGLDPSRPERLLDWLVGLLEAHQRERVGQLTREAPEGTRSLSYLRGRGRRAAAEERLDRQVMGLDARSREALLARDYLKGDWDFVQQKLGLASEDEAKAAYRRAQELLHERIRRRLRKPR